MTIKDTAEHWQVTGGATPFQGAKTSVRTDKVVMPDGSVAKRDYQVHPGSVAVLALDEEQRVVVINQYRHPVRRRLWELPAGLLDVPGENPLHAASRELYEEVHLKAGQWRVLIDVYPTPGGSDEALRVFLATELTDAGSERFAVEDEEADMRHDRIALPELVRGALSGALHNAGLVTGVLALSAVLAADGPQSLRPADAPWPARPFDA
ncbi:NUDIX hydrolase [Streptomyces sp. NPDC049954]|uniref:NUDIX hydrolase n=1 Tax=Streptomyces sp. NPDC049954 TaxID=3155779 RepID=UPI003417E14B